MVKINRNPVPPASLEIEKQKVHGSYNKPDVIQQLKEDSHDKCYICELGGLSDPEVEHLRPHHNRKILERVFDWDNLFYACPHCNNLKKEAKYDDKIIDCCIEDPEEKLEQCYTFVQVSDIKRQVLFFYLGMSLKGRKKIADKALSKMGRKKLSVWMKL